jgi:pimeloyl-ACP methyl ester carboxylesterase
MRSDEFLACSSVLAEMATYVLIAGAGGAAWYWHRVLPLLKGRGHAVVAPDLPATDESKTFEDYGEAVVAAIGGRRELVVVAQSMGAYTAAVVSHRLPVELVILLNAMVPAAGESAGQWWSATGQVEAARKLALAEGRDPDAEFDPWEIFLHDVPQDVAIESAKHAPDQAGRPFGEQWNHPWPQVPTRYVLSRDDRLFPADFQRRLCRDRLGIEPVEVDGGHLVALSRPRELVDALESIRQEALD